ncbi:MAG: argininosuccinate synthase [Polyangiaceae bacterium]|nr:argininosuccinate synthase [Planctomycetota bacterium]NUQ76152.1 argininosuccinate synthase [Polyangiaceae bacterium]
MAKKGSKNGKPAKGGKAKKCILLYSGGLDTSVIVHWLAQKGYDVVCVTVDVGQQEETNFEAKALASGAKKFIVKNIAETFVRDGVFQCIRAEAKYEGRYLLGTSIARPFMIQAIVDVAKEEGTTIIAHGATGKGNDQCRFELAAYALIPDATILAPWRDAEFRALIPGRTEAIAYAKKHGIPVAATAKKPWSTDPNLQHRSHEAGELEDPSRKPRDEMYQMVATPQQAPDKAETVEVTFERGYPVAVNGKKLGPVELLGKLNEIAGRNGVGVVDMVENRFVGMKSRGVYEAPGATVLYEAHRDLEGLTMPRKVMQIRDGLIPTYAQLVYDGFWFDPAKECLDALIDSTQQTVTGTVRLELYKGSLRVTGRKSPYSLYDESIATMEGGGSFNQDDSTGFLRIQGLPVKIYSSARRKLK